MLYTLPMGPSTPGDISPSGVPPEVVSFMARVIAEIINPVIGVLAAAALVYFLWGLIMFILNAGNESKRGEYKQHILWGLIGFVVMLSAYALIELGLATFGITGASLPEGLPVL